MTVLATAMAGPIVAVACGPAPLEGVGLSSPRAAGASPGLDAAPAHSSLLPADFREHMTRVIARQLSRGHGERFDAVVWVNDAALAGWSGGGVLADGSLLVEEALDMAAKGDRLQGLLTMEKKDGAWTFRAVGTDGGVVTDARCEECHAEAQRDDVFRVDQSMQAAMTDAMTATVPTAVATTAATTDARSAGRADSAVSP